MAPREFTLEEMAGAAQMTPRNVRAYQTRGLLLPPRRRGRHVVYGTDHLGRLRLVRALHERGLSLEAVGHLIERGVAEAELSRMLREDLAQVRPESAVVHQPLLAESLQDYPELVEDVVTVGLARLAPDGMRVESALLSLVNAAYTHGIPGHHVVRLCVLAARAGRDLRPQVEAHLPRPAGPDRVTRDEVVRQLVGAAFVRGLAHAMHLGEDGDRPAAPRTPSTPAPGPP